MAEIGISILPANDGDIVTAHNRRTIRCVHAEHICWARGDDRRIVGRKGDGLWPMDHILRQWYELVSEFKNECLNKKRNGRRIVKRTKISTGEEIEFLSGLPFKDFNGKRVSMDVDRWLTLRDVQGKKVIFGRRGREVFYGGKEDRSHESLDKIWAMIEAMTSFRESAPEHQHFPIGAFERFYNIPLTVDDFDDDGAQEMKALQVIGLETRSDRPDDPPTELLGHRTNQFVNWRESIRLSDRLIDEFLDKRDRLIAVSKLPKVIRAIVSQNRSREWRDRRSQFGYQRSEIIAIRPTLTPVHSFIEV